MPSLALVKSDWQEHAKRIATAWQKGVGSIIETGQALIAAKSELEHGSFEAMVQMQLPFGPRTARRLMAIAEHPVLSNRTHASVLPPSWMTLYELTKVPSGILTARIEDRTINPKIERKQIAEILPPRQRVEKKRRRGKPLELPKINQHERDLEFLLSAWQQACDSAREEFMRQIGR